jgi:outer membrane protein OmpA-like peptidoglycan-associated protein
MSRHFLIAICRFFVLRFTVIAVVLLAVFPFATNVLSASQDTTATDAETLTDTKWRVGAVISLSRFSSQAKLPIANPVEKCGCLERGESWGFWGGVGVERELWSGFEVSGRLLYARRELALVASNVQLSEVLTANGYVPFLRDVSYSAIVQFVVGDFGVRVQPVPSVPVYVRIGADVSFPITVSAGTTTERITQPAPDAVRFPNGEFTQTTTQAAPRLALPSLGVTGALGVEIPLRSGMMIALEAGYRFGIGSVARDAGLDWRMNSLQAALGLRWKIFQRNEVPPVEPYIAPPVEKPAIIPPVVVTSIAGKPLEIRETVVTQTFPLLPYIFFDSASTIVRDRYNPRIGVVSRFSEAQVPKETLPIYYHLLHIVGKRMRERPASTITVTGTTDGKEWATADSRQILALQRARAVASFLAGYWGIPQSRIRLATRDTPALASNARYAQGNEENRRVELSSSDPAILNPVLHSRFLEFTPVQSEVFVSVQVQSPEQVESYEGRIERVTIMGGSGGNSIVALTRGAGAPPGRLPFSLGRKFETNTSRTDAIDSLRCVLDVSLKGASNDSKILTAETMLPVQTSTNQFEVSRLNLIVFDFDRDDMAEANQTMLRRFVREAIKPESTITILGSTDRLGEASYNQELSAARARSVRDLVLRVNPAAQIQDVRGTGASLLPFDNDLPEGRYYCRTVSITVQTPRQ